VSIPIAKLQERSHLFYKKSAQPTTHDLVFSPLCRLSPTVEFIHHPNLDLFSDHRKSLENLFQNSCALKFTQVHILAFLNFLQFSVIFWDFPNYFCHPNFLIHFPKSRNQFLLDFLFLFFSSPAGPPTPSALACRSAQAA
jgi:hypothetical protein